MSFLDRWRSTSSHEEPEIEGRSEEDRDIEQPFIDVKTPRECIYKSFPDAPEPCPRCGGSLIQQPQTYLVATRRGRRITDSFMLGSDFGWFCTDCPTVVIDPEDVGEMLAYALPGWDTGEEFTVVGLVDLDAIPEEKEHLPLGGDDNPIPLVEFTNISRGGAGGGSSRQRKRADQERPSRKGKRRRRRRRRRR